MTTNVVEQPEVTEAPQASDASPARRRSLFSHWPAILIAALVVIATLIPLSWFLSGGRWFFVETPSMGRAAPVGSLVITQPASTENVHKGDLIAFHPPQRSTTYTHRVANISPDGLSTKGDINAANDPWVVPMSNLEGRAVAVIPAAGWAIRKLPPLLLATVLLWFLGSLTFRGRYRAAYLLAGVPIAFSILCLFFKPFVAIADLGRDAVRGVLSARVVSTGIMPIRLELDPMKPVHLEPGQVGMLPISYGDKNRFVNYTISPDLTPLMWILLIVVCLSPIVIAYFVKPKPADEDAL